MAEISVKSAEYQSLQTLLIQKNPLNRLQQYREREAKEALDLQATASTQATGTGTTAADKATTVPERARIGSSVKSNSETCTASISIFVSLSRLFQILDLRQESKNKTFQFFCFHFCRKQRSFFTNNEYKTTFL